MRQTILLADDSPTIQRLVVNTFAGEDFEIVSVSNGEAAIRKFEEAPPNIVLADIFMPGKNGYEVCEHIKQHSARGKTPVILLVGAFDAFDEEKAREAGAAANITKPFEPQALIDLVESLLDAGATSGDPDSTQVLRVAAAPASPASPAPPAPEDSIEPASDAADLLGLEELFVEPVPDPQPATAPITDSDVDRIADRVIQRLSAQVVESIAWEIVPDIAEKIVREEMKRSNEA